MGHKDLKPAEGHAPRIRSVQAIVNFLSDEAGDLLRDD